MTLTEFNKRPLQVAEDIGFVILDKEEYTLNEWDQNNEANIAIHDKDFQKHLCYFKDRFFIKKENPIVFWHSTLCDEILETVYAIKLEDI